MKNIVDGLRMHRHRSTTKANYYCIWRNFNKVLIKLDEKPNTWEDRLILFVGYLVQHKLKSTTLNSYISAIKSVLKQDGIDLNEDCYLLNSLTKTCRYVNDYVRTRLPIQKGLCGLIINFIENYHQELNQPYLAIMYMSLFTSAYYRLLRVGELTTGDHVIKVSDVHMSDNKNKVLFVLHTSKTHWKDNKPQLVKITSVPSKYNWSSKHQLKIDSNINFCPYQLVHRYICNRWTFRSPNEPFFIFKDHTPVKPTHVQNTLHFALTSLGFDAQKYGTHSFRIGRSVDMYNANVEFSIIKKIGRWKSNIIYSYLAC